MVGVTPIASNASITLRGRGEARLNAPALPLAALHAHGVERRGRDHAARPPNWPSGSWNSTPASPRFLYDTPAICAWRTEPGPLRRRCAPGPRRSPWRRLTPGPSAPAKHRFFFVRREVLHDVILAWNGRAVKEARLQGGPWVCRSEGIQSDSTRRKKSQDLKALRVRSRHSSIWRAGRCRSIRSGGPSRPRPAMTSAASAALAPAHSAAAMPASAASPAPTISIGPGAGTAGTSAGPSAWKTACRGGPT